MCAMKWQMIYPSILFFSKQRQRLRLMSVIKKNVQIRLIRSINYKTTTTLASWWNSSVLPRRWLVCSLNSNLSYDGGWHPCSYFTKLKGCVFILIVAWLNQSLNCMNSS
jgi:hypothetical protein